MEKLAAWMGAFLAPILKPIVMECLREYFTDKAYVSKPNDALQQLADDGLRQSGILHSTGGATVNQKATKMILAVPDDKGNLIPGVETIVPEGAIILVPKKADPGD